MEEEVRIVGMNGFGAVLLYRIVRLTTKIGFGDPGGVYIVCTVE